MIVSIILILLICLAGLAIFAGGILLVIGALKKKKAVMLTGGVVVTVSVIAFAAGSMILSVKIFHKLKSVQPAQVWQPAVNAAFDDTAVRPKSPTEAKKILKGILGNTAALDQTTVQGVWVEGVVFSYGFFIYSANTNDILHAVSSAPIDPTFHQLPSDDSCKEITWDECKSDLLYEKGPEHSLPGWNPEAVVAKRCYQCLRAPWLHTILIDEQTGIVYHSIEEIRE